jgi:hypothetical protein
MEIEYVPSLLQFDVCELCSIQAHIGDRLLLISLQKLDMSPSILEIHGNGESVDTPNREIGRRRIVKDYKIDVTRESFSQVQLLHQGIPSDTDAS